MSLRQWIVWPELAGKRQLQTTRWPSVSWMLTGARVRRIRDRFDAVRVATRRFATPVNRRFGLLWGTVSPVGRAVLLLTLIAWVLAWKLSWQEMSVVAGAGVVLLVAAACFMIGSTRLLVNINVEPLRVTVGESVAGEIEVINKARTPLLPVVLELPVGSSGVGFDLPAMLPEGKHSELFVVPTQHRGVISVGPVTTSRGDALGLFRREVHWTKVTEIFVHPKVTPLEPLGAGIMRDLEGNSAENISMSDLAFHALREYVPGDDLRHAHWRSSAKHGQLLVRQYLDTRRSHLNAIVDQQLDAYHSEEDYELAISVAASLLVRAILDGYDASFLSGKHTMTRGTGKASLDSCARAEPGIETLTSAAARSSRLAPDTSLLFLITGPKSEFVTLQRASSHFPSEVTKVGIRIDSSSQAAMRSAGELPVMTLGRLEELPVLLNWGI